MGRGGRWNGKRRIGWCYVGGLEYGGSSPVGGDSESVNMIKGTYFMTRVPTGIPTKE